MNNKGFKEKLITELETLPELTATNLAKKLKISEQHFWRLTHDEEVKPFFDTWRVYRFNKRREIIEDMLDNKEITDKILFFGALGYVKAYDPEAKSSRTEISGKGGGAIPFVMQGTEKAKDE